MRNSGIIYFIFYNEIFSRKYLLTVFVGTSSDLWSVHPLKKVTQNVIYS